MSEAKPRILIVDDSRMVRASLVKNLKDHFDIREEADGEAAWQTIVLDSSLVAVISDLQMPKLDGFGLLEKVRASKLRRLQQIPFVLVSGAESEEERERAKSMGVSDFITKGSGTAEILTRLNHLLELTNARDRIESTRDNLVQDEQSGMFTRKYLELHLAQALSHAARRGSQVSVTVLGLDSYGKTCDQVGSEVADQVAARFGKMLAGRMRQEDALGHFEPGQFVIVSPGSSPANSSTFVERIREAVAVAHVVAQGQKLSLSISAGVANSPVDHVVSAGDLVEVAASRMREAMEAGGNRIVSSALPEPEQAPALTSAETPKSLSLQEALEALRSNQAEMVAPHLKTLGVQLLPLLRLMEDKMQFGFPLAEFERLVSEQDK